MPDEAGTYGNDTHDQWFSPNHPHFVSSVQSCSESELEIIDPAIEIILRLI